MVMREELVKSVLEVKKVSDTLMAMKLEVKGSILKIVSAYTPQVGNSMEEKNDFLARLGWVDRKCIKTGQGSARCKPK